MPIRTMSLWKPSGSTSRPRRSASSPRTATAHIAWPGASREMRRMQRKSTPSVARFDRDPVARSEREELTELHSAAGIPHRE